MLILSNTDERIKHMISNDEYRELVANTVSQYSSAVKKRDC